MKNNTQRKSVGGGGRAKNKKFFSNENVLQGRCKNKACSRIVCASEILVPRVLVAHAHTEVD